MAHEYRLITTVNARFVPVLKLWLEFAKSAGVQRRIEVFCFDDASYAEAQELERCGFGLEARRFRPESGMDTMRDFIVSRFRVFEELLGKDVAFVHTDLDAFCLSDPFSCIRLDSADAVFSRAFGWPPEAVEKWGFTLCGGWFAIAPTAGIKRWFARASERLQRLRSDQKALAEVLLEAGTTFTEGDDGAVASVDLDGDRFSVRVLSNDQVTRADQPGPESVVYHPVLRPTKYLDAFLALHREFWKSNFEGGDFVKFVVARLAEGGIPAHARLAFDKLVANKQLEPAARLAQQQARLHPEKASFWSLQVKTTKAAAYDQPGRRNLTHLANFHGSDKGTAVAPYHDYAGFYQMLFDPLRDQPIRFLEIGLQKKGDVTGARKGERTTGVPSVDMWLDFFPNAQIYGFDKSDFSTHVRDRFQFVRGDLSSREDIEGLKRSAPSFHVVLDDGSHASWHQLLALCVLAPHVEPGGLFVIEDLHHQPAYVESTLPAVPRMTELLEHFRDNGFFPRINDVIDEQLDAVASRIMDMHLVYGDKRFGHALKAAALRLFP